MWQPLPAEQLAQQEMLCLTGSSGDVDVSGGSEKWVQNRTATDQGAGCWRKRRRWGRQPGAWLGLAAVFVLISSMVLPAYGQSSVAVPELRFGTVSWEQTGPKRILFKIESAWTPLSDPAKATDTLYCETPSCGPIVGTTLAMRTPTNEPTSNRWVFGDESFTRRTNGTALRGMKVVEARLKNVASSVFPYTTYLNTYTEVEYEYPQVGVYVAALTGCCRSWDKLLNHRGYGWNISATVVVDSLWEPIQGIPPSKGGPYSPVIPFVPEVVVTAGVSTEFNIRAVDKVRSASPALCVAGSGGTSSGCRFTYSLATPEQAGYNLSVGSFRAARERAGNPAAGGGVDLGFPYGVYTSNLFPRIDSGGVDPLDPRITLDPVTGLLRIPAAVTADMPQDTIYQAGGYRVLSLVVRVRASPVPRPDGRSTRDAAGGSLTPAIHVSIEVHVIIQSSSVPRVALPSLISSSVVTSGPQDVSAGPYVDFFCEYKTEYFLNSTGEVRLVTPANGLNYSALGSGARGLELRHRPDVIAATLGLTNWLINISWSPPCTSIGVYAACLLSCNNWQTGSVCSPPACFRLEVRGDCLQGDSVWLPPTPPEYLGFPDREPLPVLMGETLQFRVRSGGVPIGTRDGISMTSILGFLDAGVVPAVGPDRMIAVLSDPGLPSGASEGVNIHEGEHNVSRLFSWTPQAGQEGIAYMICFQSQSARKPGYCIPSKRCIRVKAVVPKQAIVEAVLEVPLKGVARGGGVLIGGGGCVDKSMNLALGASVDSPDGLELDCRQFCPQSKVSTTGLILERGGEEENAATDGRLETYWDEVDYRSEYRLRVRLSARHAGKEVGLVAITGLAHNNSAPKKFEVFCDKARVMSVQDAVYVNTGKWSFGSPGGREYQFIQSMGRWERSFAGRSCAELELVISQYYGPSPAIREVEIYALAPTCPDVQLPAGMGEAPEAPAPRFIAAAGSVAEAEAIPVAAGCLVTVRISVDRSIQGAILEPEATVGIPKGAKLEAVHELQGQNLGGGLYRDVYEISWRPSREFRHHTYPACLRVYDTLGSRSSATGKVDGLGGASGVPVRREQDLCYRYDMLRCRFCAQGDQSLQHVAAYWYGADWLQMWGANPEITEPDRLVDNQLLRLGPTYFVKEGDTLSRLADRYGMSLSVLQSLNPEADERQLAPGDALCIMPAVCTE